MFQVPNSKLVFFFQTQIYPQNHFKLMNQKLNKSLIHQVSTNMFMNRINLYSVVHFNVDGAILCGKRYSTDQEYSISSIFDTEQGATIVTRPRSFRFWEIFSENKSNLTFQTDMLSFKEGIPSAETAIIKPNLNSIRKILGGDGTDQQRKVVEENTGLIPKYYKASIIIF